MDPPKEYLVYFCEFFAFIYGSNLLKIMKL